MLLTKNIQQFICFSESSIEDVLKKIPSLLSLLSKKIYDQILSLLLLFILFVKILSSLKINNIFFSRVFYSTHRIKRKRTHLKRERERERSTCVEKEEELCLWRIRVVFPCPRPLKKKNTKLCILL